MESDFANIMSKICAEDPDLSSMGIYTDIFKSVAMSLPFMGLVGIRRS